MPESPTIHLSNPRGWLLTCAVAGFAFLAATLVPVQSTVAQGQPVVEIQASTDGIAVEFFATTPRNVLTLSVRVVGPERFVFEQRIEDATLQWIPPNNLADGSYNWEAWVVTADVGARMRALTPALEARSTDHWFDNEVKQTHLASGTFKVENGLIESIFHSHDENVTSRTKRVARMIFNLFIPSAQAGEVIEDFVFISGEGARLDLSGGAGTGNPDAGIRNFEGALVLRTGSGSGTGIPRLTILNKDGNFGSKAGNVGIGTTTPTSLLEVDSPSEGTAIVGQLPFRVRVDGFAKLCVTGNGGVAIGGCGQPPTNGLHVVGNISTFSGNISTGTSVPAAPLHVRRFDNTAQVRVEDTGTGSPQVMFQLINNGFPQFRLSDTSQDDVNWEFRLAGTAGTTERFTITKLNTGAAEMELRHNGNMIIRGTLTQLSSRAAKERISDLEPEAVLARLEQLGVHEWSYLHSPKERHVGPMAEEFHAAFGLGESKKHIAPGDLAGVALAAAKGLKAQNELLEARTDLLLEENRAKDEQLRAMEARLIRLEEMLPNTVE